MQHTIIIAMGSNHKPIINMRKVRNELPRLLSIERFSRNKWTKAVGIHSPRFLNCMALGKTTMSAEELLYQLKKLEKDCGDSTDERLQGRIHIDIDLLRYDDTQYHPTDWQRDYIITLYNEIKEKK